MSDHDPYDKVVLVQGHRHSEPVCADPVCTTYLTREQMAQRCAVGGRHANPHVGCFLR